MERVIIVPSAKFIAGRGLAVALAETLEQIVIVNAKVAAQHTIHLR